MAAALTKNEMQKYKLIYFKSRGRAEVARYLFALANVEFEDVRLDRDEWLSIKPSSPYGILPVLEVDGVKYCQSAAINRFLASEFGFYGGSRTEALRIDMIADCIGDAIADLVVFGWVLQGEAKDQAKQKLVAETIPKLVNFLSMELGSKTWLVGDKVSVADIGVYELFSSAISHLFPTQEWNYPSNLKTLFERIAAIPAIAAYIAKRPAE